MAEGVRRRTLASSLGPPQKSHHVDDAGSSPVRAEHSQATPRQKVHNYRLNFLWIVVWPGGRGGKATDIGLKFGTSPSEGKVKWLLMNNHTSLGRLGSTALVGSQSRRRTTPIRNPRVPGMLNRLDMWSWQWADPLNLYGKEDASALHESPSYKWNSWCQHGTIGRISS